MLTNLTKPQAVLAAGLIGAGGAVVAGIATSIVTQLVIMRKQDSRRWDEARRSAYSRLFKSVETLWALYGDDGVPPEDTASEEKNWDELREAYSEASLLAKSMRMVRAIDELFDATTAFRTLNDRAWSEVDRAFHEREGEFYQAARKELGLPKGQWLPFEESGRAILSDVEASTASGVATQQVVTSRRTRYAPSNAGRQGSPTASTCPTSQRIDKEAG